MMLLTKTMTEYNIHDWDIDSLKCTHLILRFVLDSVETKEMNTQLGVFIV